MSLFSLGTFIVLCGYFIDIFDMVIFSILREKSLIDLGLTLQKGSQLLGIQMLGAFLGSFFWGILGDRKGRTWSLVGTLALFSIANLLNGFVTSFNTYALCRFFAGFGLAGEMGSSIAWITESSSARKRALSVGLMSSVGCLGALSAGILGDHFPWRWVYIGSGLFGLFLTLLRGQLKESPYFQTNKRDYRWGNPLLLFKPLSRLRIYIALVLIGVPTWFTVGIIFGFAPEITKYLGFHVSAGQAFTWGYAGLFLGDMFSPLLSQWIQNRKKVILLCLTGLVLWTIGFGLFPPQHSQSFLFLCSLLGFISGYWALFALIAAEQFGTNLRATVSTTVPNTVRVMTNPLFATFFFLQHSFNLLHCVVILGIGTGLIGLISLYYIPETHGKDLDFIDS